MRVQIECGKTVHGQVVELHGKKDGDKVLFSIVKQPAGQRDDMDAVRDLTPEAPDGLLRAVVRAREALK